MERKTTEEEMEAPTSTMLLLLLMMMVVMNGILLTYFIYSFTCFTRIASIWEANSFSASQIPHILWKPKVHYRIHKPATCPLPDPDQPVHAPHPASWRSILILSSFCTWIYHVVSFPHVSPPNSCMKLFSPPYVPHDSPILFFLICSHERYLVNSSALCGLLHCSVTSSFSGPNFLLRSPFSNTLNLRSSLSVNDQVAHPYKTTGKTVVLYVLIFMFLDSKLGDTIFCSEWRQVFTAFSLHWYQLRVEIVDSFRSVLRLLSCDLLRSSRKLISCFEYMKQIQINLHSDNIGKFVVWLF